MKDYIILILMLISPIIAGAQELKGVVVDENKVPIDFANVVLLKADSTYLAGTITDENGVLRSMKIGLAQNS